jgi:hypothetical protein
MRRRNSEEQWTFSGMANLHAKGRIENLKPFKKGVSGNPTGRRKPRKPEDVIKAALDEAQVIIIEDLREAAKRLTHKALRNLEKAIDADDCLWPAQIVAAKEILDRGWGKPKEHVQAGVKLDLEWLLNRGRELERERERAASQTEERQDG